ncbi:pyridoxal-phosphate dependent enzyme, partial [Candidatus Latescibacterota bacterium]
MEGALHCAACGAETELDPSLYQCPECDGPLDFRLDHRAFPREAIQGRPASLWRYAEALPRLDVLVSLGEPVTSLVPLQIGDVQVLAKCEYELPSGSYKDRGGALLISYLKSLGVSEAVEDSSGNAGASLAAYAARAGMRLRVFCPRSAAAGKLAQIQLYGADLVRVEGPRARATEALHEYVGASGSTYASHLWQPLFLEGIRTLAYEICEQLGWVAPDYVFCPVGAGSILLGLYRGFSDLMAAGVTDAMPRLIAVQAANAAAVTAAFERGADRVEPLGSAQPTLAEGIALPAPVRDAEVLEALQVSKG